MTTGFREKAAGLRIDAACGPKRRTAPRSVRSIGGHRHHALCDQRQKRTAMDRKGVRITCHQTVHEDCMRDAPEHEFLIELGNYNRHRTAGYWGSFKAHVSYRGMSGRVNPWCSRDSGPSYLRIRTARYMDALLLYIISRCGFSERETGYLCRSILDGGVVNRGPRPRK
jgi:hypothetical protein